MTMIAAGIDVGRDSLDVAIAPSGRSFRAPNVAQGVKVVVDRLKRAGVCRVVLESIGAYAQRLVRALADAGFEVGIVDPKRIKALRLVEGKRAKPVLGPAFGRTRGTDRLDARLIARFALLMRDAARPIPDADALKLRALSTRRRQLVEMMAMEKTAEAGARSGDRRKPQGVARRAHGRARARRAPTRSVRASPA
jgi:transposase